MRWDYCFLWCVPILISFNKEDFMPIVNCEWHGLFSYMDTSNVHLLNCRVHVMKNLRISMRMSHGVPWFNLEANVSWFAWIVFLNLLQGRGNIRTTTKDVFFTTMLGYFLVHWSFHPLQGVGDYLLRGEENKFCSLIEKNDQDLVRNICCFHINAIYLRHLLLVDQ